MKRGSGRNREIYVGVRREGTSFRASKRGFFSISATVGRSGLSFASQKRTLAFYSSMKNAPFGVNSAQNAFLENVGKSVLVFAHIPEMDSPEWQTGAVAGPDLGRIPEGSGRVYLRRCRGDPVVYLLS